MEINWFIISEPLCDSFPPEEDIISTVYHPLDIATHIGDLKTGSEYTPIIFDHYKHLLNDQGGPRSNSNNQLIELIRKHGLKVYEADENMRFNSETVPSIPVIPLAYDEMFLKRPLDGEDICINGAYCEGIAVATVIGNRDGFTLKRYSLPGSTEKMSCCLLCIRRRVTLEYYNLRCRDGRTNNIIQPFCNIIDYPGEYGNASVIYADGCGDFHGIIQPIVKYQRYNYNVMGDKIDQSSLYFRQAPRHVGKFTTGLISRFRSHKKRNNIDIIYPDNFPGDYKLMDDLYQQKRYEDLHSYVISVVDSFENSKRWFTIDDVPDVVNVLSLCHFFSEKTNLKSIPIAMLISKVLPFRCQFKNFRDVCNNVISTSKHAVIFLKMVLWLSLTGGYPYCAYACPPDKCVYLAGIFMTSNTRGINSFILDNIDLTYMALKEFVAYIVQYDDPLHEVLIKQKRWLNFEVTIKTTMESARHAWYVNSMDKFRDIINNRSIKSLVGLYNNGTDRFTTLITRYVDGCVNIDIYRMGLIQKFNKDLAYRPFSDTLIALNLIDPSGDMYHVTTILRMLYDVHHFESNDISIKSVVTGLCARYAGVMSSVYAMFSLINEALKVQEIVLPLHIRSYHASALLKKYGMHYYEKNMMNINDCLYCLRCHEVKGYVIGVTTGKPSRRIRNSVGNHSVVYNKYNRKIYCQRKKIRVRPGPQIGPLIDPGPSCKDVVCQRVSLIGNLVVMYGAMFMPCFECGTATVFSFSCWYKDRFYCSKCLSEAYSEQIKRCTYCDEEVPTNYSQYAYHNGHIRVVNTCATHKVLKNYRIIDYNHLISVIYAKTMDSMRR